MPHTDARRMKSWKLRRSGRWGVEVVKVDISAGEVDPEEGERISGWDEVGLDP